MKIKERPKKSEKLPPQVREALKKWIAQQPTKHAAAMSLKLSRANMDRVEVLGSCAPATAEKIRKVLNIS